MFHDCREKLRAMPRLCDSLLAKIQEQIDKTEHLLALVPADRLDWTPAYPGAWSVGAVVAHLVYSLTGFCAVLAAVEPERLAHFERLRSKDAVTNTDIYRRHIEEGFALITDADLGKSIPTVFVAGGETVLTLLLGNLEHLINHKHQLFSYLKEMGVAVGTPDLYCLRGSS
jgi:uncharacterized damage-inducible protein DinB